MTTAAEIAQLPERPSAPQQTSEFRVSRPQIVGPDTPDAPFPILLAGAVQKGFGRGSKDLGCPTANLPDESIVPMSTVAQTGVYYGYAQVLPPSDGQSELREQDTRVHPMVMSLGWNPFYKNERLTAEVHIMHDFIADFYGNDMKVVVLGYIRPELDYVSREALIQDIEVDKLVALNSLKRPEYEKYRQDRHFDLPSAVSMD
ncbi:Flavokinase domain-containing protein [Mycena kentingensis (nom. inval.)]|nr:Flavokinase domain-containing protein [Mycena kentingensis (nom. inval.)]